VVPAQGVAMVTAELLLVAQQTRLWKCAFRGFGDRLGDSQLNGASLYMADEKTLPLVQASGSGFL
jgi:hypothetical protein